MKREKNSIGSGCLAKKKIVTNWWSLPEYDTTVGKSTKDQTTISGIGTCGRSLNLPFVEVPTDKQKRNLIP